MKSPKRHQEAVIEITQNYRTHQDFPNTQLYLPKQTKDKYSSKKFESSDRSRALLVLPCGSGKTYIGYLLKQQIDGHNVIFVPNRPLVNQTLNEWITEDLEYDKADDSTWLCIVNNDSKHIKKQATNVHITTDETEISKLLAAATDEQPITVFCTYDSAQKLKAATEQIDGFQFDLAIVDEAHRTMGALAEEDEAEYLSEEESASQTYTYADVLNMFSADFTLSMTATPTALVSDSGKIRDSELFGECIFDMTFIEAVDENLILDYNVYSLTDDTGFSKRDIQRNQYFIGHISQKYGFSAEKTTELLYHAISLLNSYSNPKIRIQKTAVYHKEINDSKAFTELVEILCQKHLKWSDIQIIHADGKSAEGLQRFVDFPRTKKSILSNCQAFSEGLSVNDVDTVYFASTRLSVSALIQIIGRAVRKWASEDTPEDIAKYNGNVIVPIFKSYSKAAQKKFHTMLSYIQLNRSEVSHMSVLTPSSFGETSERSGLNIQVLNNTEIPEGQIQQITEAIEKTVRLNILQSKIHSFHQLTLRDITPLFSLIDAWVVSARAKTKTSEFSSIQYALDSKSQEKLSQKELVDLRQRSIRAFETTHHTVLRAADLEKLSVIYSYLIQNTPTTVVKTFKELLEKDPRLSKEQKSTKVAKEVLALNSRASSLTPVFRVNGNQYRPASQTVKEYYEFLDNQGSTKPPSK